MTTVFVALCTIELHLPGIGSLKGKRSVIKSMLARLRNTFNISVAEVDHHDVWQSSTIAFSAVSNSRSHVEQMTQTILDWIETNYPDEIITHHETEVL